MKHVYIVENGEKHKGGSPVSVHLSYETAREAALKVKPLFDGGWVSTEEGYWTNGCDYVTIIEMDVQE